MDLHSDPSAGRRRVPAAASQESRDQRSGGEQILAGVFQSGRRLQMSHISEIEAMASQMLQELLRAITILKQAEVLVSQYEDLVKRLEDQCDRWRRENGKLRLLLDIREDVKVASIPAYEKPKHWFESNTEGFGPEHGESPV
jgi:hypothetical protein